MGMCYDLIQEIFNQAAVMSHVFDIPAFSKLLALGVDLLHERTEPSRKFGFLYIAGKHEFEAAVGLLNMLGLCNLRCLIYLVYSYIH